MLTPLRAPRPPVCAQGRPRCPNEQAHRPPARPRAPSGGGAGGGAFSPQLRNRRESVPSCGSPAAQSPGATRRYAPPLSRPRACRIAPQPPQEHSGRWGGPVKPYEPPAKAAAPAAPHRGLSHPQARGYHLSTDICASVYRWPRPPAPWRAWRRLTSCCKRFTVCVPSLCGQGHQATAPTLTPRARARCARHHAPQFKAVVEASERLNKLIQEHEDFLARPYLTPFQLLLQFEPLPSIAIASQN